MDQCQATFNEQASTYCVLAGSVLATHDSKRKREMTLKDQKKTTRKPLILFRQSNERWSPTACQLGYFSLVVVAVVAIVVSGGSVVA